MAQAKATAGNARTAANERGKVTERGRMTVCILIGAFIACIIFAVADQSPEWLREGALWAALAVGALAWALDVPAATERGKVTERGRITAARSHSVNLNVSPA